jgi:hypoxanthine phosphoribosyltransferase
VASEQRLGYLLNRDEIAKTVVRLASEINYDYRGKRPLLVGALKGAFIFMADLVRHLDLPVEIEFIRASSYGAGRESSGEVSILQDMKTPAEGRDIIIVEDIVDTGLTASFLLEYLRRKDPLSLKLCALLNKPSSRLIQVKIDYLGFTIPDKFIVGYGLDYKEDFRHLPDVCYLED